MIVAAGAIALLAGAAFDAGAGIVSPRQGGALPESFVELKARSRRAFTLKHGWIERRSAQVLGDARFRPFFSPPATALRSPETALSGHFAMPVVMGLYSNVSTPPVTASAVSNVLFGSLASGTLRDYYHDMSFNLFDVSGTVFDWVSLAHTEDYYINGLYRGIDTDSSKTGNMIKELADALDPTVDFGSFDNDGPDGVPNSGDDDGFVDVLLVVHPTWGAECDYSLHMWSHSFTYSGWPVSGGQPYSTNDAAANGGTIKIDDYIIVPALSCEGTKIIEIGVICHEFGHVLGLPDLYDYDGGSSGIGYWGLMGAGNWNTPESPAYLECWSREQLGWLNPIDIDWRSQQLSLWPIETTADAVRMVLPTRRFKRQLYSAGEYGLLCGYPTAEALKRGWPGSDGYGNGWNESLFHEFSVNASRPVTLAYDVRFDTETNYDFGKLLLEAGGGVETLAVYTGTGSRHESIDLGSHLPAGAVTFTVRFLFQSDFSASDEDGGYNSASGRSFAIDDMSLTGGGLVYAADFQLDSGGWRQGSAPAEYILAENRRRRGFDGELMGEGLLIWHAENSILYSYLGNSGGASNAATRGLVVEEADGLGNLTKSSYNGGNYGDAGDPFPGSTGNTSYGPTTNPRSETNGGVATPVAITGITLGAPTCAALFKAGMPAPTIAEVVPATIDKETETEAALDVRGAWMRYPSTVSLALGADTVEATETVWLGEERVIAAVSTDRLYAGDWDLVVRGGDGQIGSAASAVFVQSVFESARVTAGRDYLRPEWVLRDRPDIRGCILFRSENGGAFIALTDTLREGSGTFAYRDSTVLPAVPYSFKIAVYLNGGREEIYMLIGPYRVERLPFIVDQNYPNPFNGGTTISFFVPAARRVTIEVFDAAGRLVQRVADREYGRGDHAIAWDPADRGVRAGIYFCRVKSLGDERVIKLIYVP